MFGWLKELLDIRYENRQRNAMLKLEVKERVVTLEPESDNLVICESCETLKQQLSIANAEKKQLLDRILAVPEKEVIATSSDLTPIRPKNSGRWQDTRRELEANDRRTASVLAAKENELKLVPTAEEVKEFEKELDTATEKRVSTGEKHG